MITILFLAILMTGAFFLGVPLVTFALMFESRGTSAAENPCDAEEPELSPISSWRTVRVS